MIFTTDNVINAIIAGGASIPTWFAVLVEDTGNTGFLKGLAASIFLLVLGKVLDVIIKLVLDKYRRGDGKSNSETENSNNNTHQDQGRS